MNIKFVEVFQQKNVSHQGLSVSKQHFSLRSIFINPEHIVCMRADELMKGRLDEGLLPDDMDSRQEFTKLYIDRGHSGLDITVVGTPETVQKKIDENAAQQKTLLKG